MKLLIVESPTKAKTLTKSDGVDAVVDGLHGPHEVLGYGWGDDGLGIGALHVPDHLGVEPLIL